MLVNKVIEDRICYVEMQNAEHYYKEGIQSFLEKRPPQYKGKAKDLD